MSITSLGSIAFNVAMLDRVRPRNIEYVTMGGGGVTMVEATAVYVVPTEIQLDQRETNTKQEVRPPTAPYHETTHVYAAVASVESAPPEKTL